MICLLGFGEVGQVFAEDFGGKVFTAWDIKFACQNSSTTRALEAFGIAPPISPHVAVKGVELIISAVTAAQTEAAAQSVAKGLRPGCWFMDVNSSAPAQKLAAASWVEGAGGRYVEAVIMSPIGARRIGSPILLGGPHAHEFLLIIKAIGFYGASVHSAAIGPASAAKLCRSVVVKGLEALLTESMLAARHYGVEKTVLDSLKDLFPDQNLETLATYLISRGLQHGKRRAEEMREAAETVVQAGLEPIMSLATAIRQDWSATHKNAMAATTLETMLDDILIAVRSKA